MPKKQATKAPKKDETAEIVISPAGEITHLDLKSLGTTLAIVVLSAVITKLIEILPGLHVSSEAGQIIMAVIIVALKAVQKFLGERVYIK